MTDPKTKSLVDGSKFLRDAFALQQKLLKTSIAFASQTITHPGIQGEVNESHFIDMLKKYLPKRYNVDSAIVIDSKGKTSDQTDIIIFDNQYTPTLLDQKRHRFIPAEAIYAVLEVKPIINKDYLQYAAEKARSVRSLKRTSIKIQHAGGVYPPRKLFKIVAGIVAADIDWKDGFLSKAFTENHKMLKGNLHLDCGLALSGWYFDTYGRNKTSLRGDNVLAPFIFRLLQKLQSLGTVPAIDWNAYAETMKDK
jgi:hypothetical protein